MGLELREAIPILDHIRCDTGRQPVGKRVLRTPIAGVCHSHHQLQESGEYNYKQGAWGDNPLASLPFEAVD